MSQQLGNNPVIPGVTGVILLSGHTTRWGPAPEHKALVVKRVLGNGKMMDFSLKGDYWVMAVGECETGEENQEKSSPSGT